MLIHKQNKIYIVLAFYLQILDLPQFASIVIDFFPKKRKS